MKIYKIDSFTDVPFSGNPAGVVITQSILPDSTMQKIALEMNCSETAFLVRGKGYYTIRYYTPEIEVPLCGHATLASAYILFLEFEDRASKLLLKARDFDLEIGRRDEWISMAFPVDELIEDEMNLGLIQESLGLQKPPAKILKSKFGWYLVHLDREIDLRAIVPDFQKMRHSKLSILITSLDNEEEFDFVSRFFAPAAGIDEDPVTGLAHCSLGQYWSGILGKTDLTGLQLSRREGVVRVIVEKDRNIILGQAVKTMEIQMDPEHLV